MMQAVLLVCLSVILITVASNPVTQVLPAQQCSICQQHPYNNAVSLPATYQRAGTQTNPYSQPITVQNQTPSRQGFDGSINQLFMSKILENPSLRKILDPNTKLYNQNGQEIQRNPDTGTAPSVVNNYFIVPPEFFRLNDTKINSNNTSKRRRVNSERKTNQTKTKNETVKKESNKLIDEKPSKRRKKLGRTRTREIKRKQDETPAKIKEKNVEIFNEDENGLRPEIKKSKKRRKQNPINVDKKANITTPPLIDNMNEEDPNEKEILPLVNNNGNKRRKKSNKSRNHSKITNKELSETLIDSGDTTVMRDDVSTENKKGNSKARSEDISLIGTKHRKTKDVIECITSSESMTQLKNIESPVDNQETIKDLTENMQTKNSKNNKVKKENKSTQSMTPKVDDVLKNLFPYMYHGNRFYPDLYNFNQLYQPNIGRNSRKNKKRKIKLNKNESNKESLQNIVDVKLKTKKQETTTIINNLSEEITEAPTDSTSIEITTKYSEPVTDIPMEVPHKVFPIQESDESLADLETVIPKPESAATKAKIKMPPTVIEDLDEFLTPAIGREDKVPTIYTNGIISDYYPIFYDDYTDDSYYLKDLDDDRHFYTTDRSHEELLNRERRKYDIHDEPRTSYLDNRDRVNFRRRLIYRDRDRVNDVDENNENSIQRPYTRAKILIKENTPAVTETNREARFQMPPMLEKPDFRTNEVVTVSSTSKSHDLHEPVYINYSAETVPETFNTYSETTLPQFGRVVNIESEIRKEKGLPSTTRPRNDHIETVFAKTRVVKYGVEKDESEENVSVSMPAHEDDGEMKHYSDGHTTYVVAKSLGKVDDYYW